jgi:hypothetical protein
MPRYLKLFFIQSRAASRLSGRSRVGAKSCELNQEAEDETFGNFDCNFVDHHELRSGRAVARFES